MGGKRSLHLHAGKKPQLRAGHGNRFTAAKQKKFFETLAATCNVSASARKARITAETVYQHRRKNAAFRARWAEALSEGYAKLELMLLERSMNGTVKTVTRANGAVDKTHEYPNGLALQLLKLHRDSVAAAEAEHDEGDLEEVRRRLARKLEIVRRRLGGAEPDGGESGA